MFGPYVQLLKEPGAARFSSAGLLARMQMSMIGIGVVMLLSAERDSYAIGGAISAIMALSGAVVSPQFSRLIDARGQRRVVPLQLSIHLPAISLLIFFALATDLTWPLLVLAFFAGAATPNIGPLVRTRWSAMLGSSSSLRTAFAWESLVDEIVFILGPVLATVVALQLFPAAAMILATILLLGGTVLLIVQHSTEPPASGRSRIKRQRPAILLPGVAGVTAVSLFLGGMFGSFEVTTVAFAKEAGEPGAAGLLLATYSIGSLSAGLVFGVLHLKSSLPRQLAFAATALAVITLPLPWLGSVVAVGAGLLVAGVAVSPALIISMQIIEKAVPSGRLTEAISWDVSGLAVGIAVFTPLAGTIIDHRSASDAYWVTSACAVAVFLVAAAVLPSLRRALAAQGGDTLRTRPPGVPAGVAVESTLPR